MKELNLIYPPHILKSFYEMPQFYDPPTFCVRTKTFNSEGDIIASSTGLSNSGGAKKTSVATKNATTANGSASSPKKKASLKATGV